MVNISVTGDTLADVFAQLNALTHTQVDKPAVAVAETAPDVPAAPVVVEEPEAPPTISATVEPPSVVPVAPPAGKALTHEEVRALGIAAGRKHGNDAVRFILNKHFGVLKMSELSEEQYPEFVEKLGELDAK